MSCQSSMTPVIQQQMRAFSRRLIGAGPMPFWAESAMKQHAEYAAADYCKARGLQGLGAAEFDCAALPSSTAAADLLDGKPGGVASVVTSTAMRAGLIAAGLAVAGERKHLVKYSVFAALAIEAFVLSYVAATRKKAA